MQTEPEYEAFKAHVQRIDTIIRDGIADPKERDDLFEAIEILIDKLSKEWLGFKAGWVSPLTDAAIKELLGNE